MIPKTKHQEFKEWLSSATIDELEEELFELDETNLSLLAQIERDDLRIKVEPPTPENGEWRVRVDHLQRWTYYQKKAIERRIAAINRKLAAELRAENARLNVEAARLKSERVANLNTPEAELRAENARLNVEAARLKSERVANLNTPEAELRRAENKRLTEEAIRLKHERSTSWDATWIAAAKIVLDKATFKQITTIAYELNSTSDRQQEEQ